MMAWEVEDREDPQVDKVSWATLEGAKESLPNAVQDTHGPERDKGSDCDPAGHGWGKGLGSK